MIEDLAVKNMVKNKHLSRHIADAGWGEFRRMLEYKTQWYGAKLVVAPRFYPSSRMCSCCGYVLPEIKLSTRHWACPICGAYHDRDINAAVNLLRYLEAARLPRVPRELTPVEIGAAAERLKSVYEHPVCEAGSQKGEW